MGKARQGFIGLDRYYSNRFLYVVYKMDAHGNILEQNTLADSRLIKHPNLHYGILESVDDLFRKSK